MDVSLLQIFGVLFGVFVLILLTILLIGFDRVQGLFYMSTPGLTVYDPFKDATSKVPVAKDKAKPAVADKDTDKAKAKAAPKNPGQMLTQK